MDETNNEPSSVEKKANDGPIVKSEGFFDTNWHEVVDNFDDMNLNSNLLRGIYAYGFEKPSPIQQRAIMPCVRGHDVITQARSGTGKIATFSISVLQQIDPSRRECQALIITRTRDLAQQITKVVTALGDFMKVECHTCIGGTHVRDEMRKLEMGVHIIVGTTGRVFDMMLRNAIHLSTIKLFVLDKANEISSKSFKEQVRDIFEMLPVQVQVILSSDKMPDILEISKIFKRDPKSILVIKDELTLEVNVNSVPPSAEKKACDDPIVEPEVFIHTNWHEVVDNFDDMNLNENLLRGIYACGFEKPTAIQQRAIMPYVRGHDVIVQAQSGAGKTAAYSISILQQIDLSRRECQALVMAPTHELVQIITKVMIALGDFMNIECHACIGGTNVRDEMLKLKMGVHIVIGTPGRVYNMMKRWALRPSTIKIFALNKADEMLSKSFKEQILNVFEMLPVQVQVILSSDKMPDILEISKIFKRDPKSILVIKDELTMEDEKKPKTFENDDDNNNEKDELESIRHNHGKIESTLSIANFYFDFIIGSKGSTVKKLMKETKTFIKIPQGDKRDISIIGQNERDIARAIQRINNIIKTVRKEQKPTHFVSIPTMNEEMLSNFNLFKEDILKNPPQGVDESIFIEPSKLHLTLVVMSLLDDEERIFASNLLQEAKQSIIDPLLKKGPIEVNIVGISCMNNDPKKTRVLYGEIVGIGNHKDTLKIMMDGLQSVFTKNGYGTRRQTGKLHVTLMKGTEKTTHGRVNPKGKRKQFDSSTILEKYSKFNFGTVKLEEIHLSEMHTATENSYYRPTIEIPIK